MEAKVLVRWRRPFFGEEGRYILPISIAASLRLPMKGAALILKGTKTLTSSRSGTLKVLFITGFAESAIISHGHLAPGMHVIMKPFNLEALASRMKELING